MNIAEPQPTIEVTKHKKKKDVRKNKKGSKLKIDTSPPSKADKLKHIIDFHFYNNITQIVLDYVYFE